MEDRPGTSARDSEAAWDGSGYPLRDEAIEPYPPAPPPVTPAEPMEDEIYAAPPLEPRLRVVRRRRFVPAGPWPAVLAVLLLLAALGVAYAVTHIGGRTPTARPAAAGAPQPAQPRTQAPAPAAPGTSPPPPPPATVAPPPPTTVAPAPPPTAVSHQSPPTTAAKPAAVAVPNVTGMQGLAAAHTLLGDHLVAVRRYVPSTQPARRVVSQWPRPGAKVPRGTSVQLNLSQGLRSSG
jgi:PASTA domain